MIVCWTAFTLNAPLFIALEANMHQEVVAAAIFLGLIVSVPVMILFAPLSRQGAEQIILQGFVAVQVHTIVASVVCSIVCQAIQLQRVCETNLHHRLEELCLK